MMHSTKGGNHESYNLHGFMQSYSYCRLSIVTLQRELTMRTTTYMGLYRVIPTVDCQYLLYKGR